MPRTVMLSGVFRISERGGRYVEVVGCGGRDWGGTVAPPQKKMIFTSPK